MKGKDVDLGSVRAASNGMLPLPVFRATRPGVYVIAIVDPRDGSTKYVKVLVGKAISVR